MATLYKPENYKERLTMPRRDYFERCGKLVEMGTDLLVSFALMLIGNAFNEDFKDFKKPQIDALEKLVDYYNKGQFEGCDDSVDIFFDHLSECSIIHWSEETDEYSLNPREEWLVE